MKNKLVYFLYAFTALMVVLLAYNFYGKTKRTVTDRTIKTLNSQTIKMYQKQFNTNQAFGYLWGIQELKEKSDINKTVNQTDINTTILPVTQEKGKICIADNCYRFLGFYYKEGVPFISFYSKNFKKGLQDFTLQQTLDKTLYIKEIKHNRLFIADTNSSREWQFQLFDVNATKYKPKENNETDF